jgi:MFS family permease
VAEPLGREVGRGTLITLAFSATAGVLVEFYDFTLFGFAAASAFPAIFFPKLAPTQALIFSYLTFGAGYPARLLGAFIFGHFGDRAGRKFAFLINIVVVGGSTCLTGLLPASGDGTARQAIDLTQGKGAMAVLDFVGSADSLALANQVVQPGGKVVEPGINMGSVPFGYEHQRVAEPPELTLVVFRFGAIVN